MNIVLNIDIQTTPERLYEALTTQKGIAGWFSPQAKAETKTGGLVELGFGPGQSLGFRVEKLEPASQIVWSGAKVPPEWQESRISFELKPTGKAVSFTFTHSGLPEGYEDYGFFSFCWAQYVRSIKLLLETGTGEPYGSPGSQAWHPQGD